MGERKGMKGLELWCRRVTEGYPGVKIDNMTTSWRDGLAFCAMIHHFRPDLIDFDKLNKEDVYHNNELAFKVAEHHLGIPALLEAEDMVEYEVPDRLSILTYLSQFYQTFEVARGKSGPRMATKRAQSNPDHGIVSPASTSPPTKVAATASRVRREPCAKCKLPVFIAERLNIGKLLYHRTCFKCARCSSQLTLANYYETESGQFCCEVCPDEELSRRSKHDEHPVRQQSLSDEEKSASLREDPDAFSARFESAVEFPVDTELKKTYTLSQTDSKARLNFFESQLEAKNHSTSSIDSGNEEVPPDLPSTKPPATVGAKSLVSDNKENSETYGGFPAKSFSTNDEILKVSDSFSVNKDKNFVTKDLNSPSNSVKARLRLFENLQSKQESEKVHLTRKSPEKSAKVVNLSDLEDFDNISKKETDSDGISINSEGKNVQNGDGVSKISSATYESKTREENEIDNGKNSENPAPKRFSSSKRFELKFSPNKVAQNVDTGISETSVTSTIEIFDSSIENSVFTVESDSGHISLDKDPSVIEISDTTQESDISEGGDKVRVNVEPPSPAITLSDESYLSAKKGLEASAIAPGFTTAREILPSLEITDASLKSVVETKNINVKHSENSVEYDREILPSLKIVDDQIKRIDEMTNTNVKHNQNASKNDEVSLEKGLKEFEPSDTVLIENDLNKPTEKIDISPRESNISKDAKEKFVENIVNETEDLKNIKNQLVTVKESDEIISKDTSPKHVERPDTTNPFSEEEEEEDGPSEPSKVSLNPFGEDTDEDEELPKVQTPMAATRKKKIMPREEDRHCWGTPECLQGIYIQRISVNPFETDDQSEEEEEEEKRQNIQNPTPSPRPRKKIVPLERITLNPFESEDEEEEEKIVPVPKPRNIRTSSGPASNILGPAQNHALSPSSKSSHGGSTSSISSGSAFGSARKKKPAPRPPLPSFQSPPPGGAGYNHLPGNAAPSVTSASCSPSQSVISSPVSIRSYGKTKRAPPPPPNASTPFVANQNRLQPIDRSSLGLSPIPYDNNTVEGKIEEKSFESHNFGGHVGTEKIVKDVENRNRQSFNNSYKCDVAEIDRIINNKSTHGKWKRQKGKAPSRPIPERRIIKSLPLSEIRRELDTIEIQQQGLEKQGVRLEEIIREKCEGSGDGVDPDDSLPIDVEDLILQLFELVNEKNELFRRQAELMYLRRQQRLEEEHADVEYQIRCLMMQPEANKTDSDKTREEALINRLVEIVERRNEIIECLEMDRKRETEEDDSISNQLNLYSLKRENDKESPQTEKKHKKEKIKLKKIKLPFHLHKPKEKGHKAELDKDVDTTEVNADTLDKKKKKKFNLF